MSRDRRKALVEIAETSEFKTGRNKRFNPIKCGNHGVVGELLVFGTMVWLAAVKILILGRRKNRTISGSRNERINQDCRNERNTHETNGQKLTRT